METLNFKLPVFEGPLDLLLHLIEKNKVDIYDIPILEITEQYLEILRQWDEINMEVAGEFILMAATLINIKAKKLLPSAQMEEEDQEDEEQELIRRLILYKMYKEASVAMRPLIRRPDEMIFTRKAETIRGKRPIPPADKLLEDQDLNELYMMYLRVKVARAESMDESRKNFRSIKRDHYRVSDKIRQLQEQLKVIKTVSFYQLKKEARSKDETITYFMAMLEMSRMNEVALTQERLFGDIAMKIKSEEEKAYGETLPETGA